MAIDIERAYATSASADDVAQALADNFRAHDYDVQIFHASDGATVMQAKKESLWRNLVGTAYAVTVIITPGEGQLGVKQGPHEWVDTAVSAGIGVLLIPPVLIGTIWGVWKEHSLDDRVWRIVDERTSAAPPVTSSAGSTSPAAGTSTEPGASPAAGASSEPGTSTDTSASPESGASDVKA
jgi:predicted peroxiredoxin